MKELLRHLNEPETIIFVGSGVSRWSGLPSWNGMIQELIDFLEESGKTTELVRNELINGDLLQAASYAFDQLTQQQIGDFVRRSCRYGQARPHDVHKKIAELGPTSFVTTNYDNLLEEAVREFRPNTFFGAPVTNRHLTEMASVAHAKKSDFIFKPHGDASDAESIILTREQYRKLLPQGEWNRVLETIKTLMISRPVLYIGFGLRDPDFLYVKDLLSNTFDGATRDHYAIMPDMSEQEIDYWRRSYGLHILSYDTSTENQSQTTHDRLLDLLDELKSQASSTELTNNIATDDSSFILALTRHASRLAHGQSYANKVQIGVEHKTDNHHMMPRYDIWNRYRNVDDLLIGGPQKTLLVGLPGAGKSYSVSYAVNELAKALRDASLQEEVDLSEIVIPIKIDMKEYVGNLWALAEESLPVGLSLSQLTDGYKVKIFIDSFNEMPKEYWSDARYEEDFREFVRTAGKTSIVVASRTWHGIPDSDFDVYVLDSIEAELVDNALLKNGIQRHDAFRREIAELIKRPFFYRLLQEGKINIKATPDPRSVFRQILSGLNTRFIDNFATNIDLKPVLEQVAFSTINAGAETFNLHDLEFAFIKVLDMRGEKDFPLENAINWLISQEIIQPLPKRKLAFFHQSLTEFLAASQLATRYEQDPFVLRDVLQFRRWDQAIMQTASLLTSDKSKSLLSAVFAADQRLALMSCKYIELDGEEIVAGFLERCLLSYESGKLDEHDVNWAIERDLPLTLQHVPLLRKLAEKGGSLGAAAVKRLVQLRGSSEKANLLELLFEAERDYNFLVNGVGEALTGLVATSDLPLMSDWLMKHPNLPEEDHATSSAFAAALRLLPPGDILRHIAPNLDQRDVSDSAVEILCEIARELKTEEWLKICVKLVPIDTHQAAVAIHFIVGFQEVESNISLEAVDDETILVLVNSILQGNEWALSAVSDLCSCSKKISSFVMERSYAETGLKSVILQHCASSDASPELFKCIEEMADGHIIAGVELNAMGHIEVDWSGKEELFRKVLASRNCDLLRSILPSGLPSIIRTLGKIQFPEIGKLLIWLSEQSKSDHWLYLNMASLIGCHCDSDTRRELISVLEDEQSPHRRMVSRLILNYCEGLTMSDLSDRTISYLLAELENSDDISWRPFLIAEVADHAFVQERLMPLVSGEDSLFQRNLMKVLERAGRRHGRRYFT